VTPRGNPKPPTTGESDPDKELKAARDLEAHTEELKAKVPFDVKQFTDKGMKAESYAKDEAYGHFKELVIKVDPVYLTDKITGQTTK